MMNVAFSSDGVSDQHRTVGAREAERIEHGEHVVGEAVGQIARRGDGRGREAATRDAVHVIARHQLRREVVKHVSAVARARQEHDGWDGALRLDGGAAPVEHLESNVGGNRYESHSMHGAVAPCGCCRRSDEGEWLRRSGSAAAERRPRTGAWSRGHAELRRCGATPFPRMLRERTRPGTFDDPVRW